MKRLRSFVAALIAAAALPTAAAAQAQGTVTGRVVEASSGRGLAGAQIALVGTTRRTVTDQEGRYRMESVPVGSQSLRATRIGYDMNTQRVVVAAGQTATADFRLGASAVAIDALVVNAVTGQTEAVREIGNAVGQINVAEDVPLAAISRPSDVLQGRVSGVQVQSVSGTTGTGVKIRIRGANSLSLSNEPLIIVDGIRYDNSTDFNGSFSEGGVDQNPNRLNDISPENIASIEVLKGPAASGIYGTAAANGVVVITTKQGRAGRPRWNFAAEVGTVREVTNYPDNVAGFDAGGDYCLLAQTTLSAAEGGCVQASLPRFNPLRDSRTTPFDDGARSKYALSVSGGSDRATYYLSGDWENEEGVYANNELEKVNLRSNVRALINDQLTMTANVGYTTSDVSFPSNDNSVISPILNGLLGGVEYDPEDPEAVYPFFSPSESNQYTPRQDIERFTGSINANFNPLAWLGTNVTAGVDLTNGFDNQILQPNTIPLSATWISGFADRGRFNQFQYTVNGSANARFDLSQAVRSTTTAGVDYNRQRFARTTSFGAGLVPGAGSIAATTREFRAGETNTEIITIGGFVQQQFALNERVFLTGALRADDNSAFGENFGTITYPSANVSWLLSDESFFPETRFLSSLRLRAAYGQSGLRPGFRDAVTFFNASAVQSGSQELGGITIGGTGNVELKPERTSEIEAGLDFGLLDDRIGVEVTYFNKRSSNALISRSLPPSLGLFSTRYDNLGEVRNSGVEFSLDTRVIESRPFGLNLRVTGSTLENEIEDLGGVPDIIFNRGAQAHREGRSAGAYYAPPVIFSDANNNGVIDFDEVSVDNEADDYIGPSLPTFTGSLSGEISIYDFLRVSTLFDTRRGHYTLNDNEDFRCAFFVCAGGFDPAASERAQAAFLSNTIGVEGGFSNALYIEKADFVKWRELAFTLTPPQSLVNRVGRIEGLSFTIAGRNLKTWTDYTGLDPEANETGSSSNFTQGEFGSQAPVRYWTARVNFAF